MKTPALVATVALCYCMVVSSLSFNIRRPSIKTSRTSKYGLLEGYRGGRDNWMMPEPDTPQPDPPEAPPPSRRRTPLMPTVGEGKYQKDILSQLFTDRILLLGQQVNDDIANVMTAQLLYLSQEDPKTDITIWINSPGGSVSAGLAIYDTMQFVKPDVSTVCFGMAASMGAFLLGAGAKGKRRSLPNARIMIHQPLGGAQGQATDIEISAKEILFTKALLNTYVSNYTEQPIRKVRP